MLATPPLPHNSSASSEALDGEGEDQSVDPVGSVSSTDSAPSDDYLRLQQRLLLATLIVSAIAVLITAVVFDLHIASSLLVGAMAGLLYLRLLARSVGKLGNGAKKVGKTQLLVPVVLVLASARLPQLELLPALLGFLLYKPALILQVLLDS
ncbi:ATP synthase [Synechococcus sp. LA31]|uniref:ATP synthase n=1 Tax=Synechococcus sp. LA31 TaxID=2741953 RepID=UPI001BDDBDA0|nr:ATP synthase [Synechococcus sp. LA31]QVV67547.1 ATP synthase [Synechococcus sp. LA31]